MRVVTWQERAEQSIAQACCTFSKRPDQFVEGVYPTHCLKTGDGFITDTDHREYIDWVCALGANNIGNTNISSLPSIYEVELAEKLKDIFHIERVKFLKTGSEACSASLRFARAFTGRKQVAGTGYHGYLNEFISEELPGCGTIYQHYTKLDDIDLLTKFVASAVELAAVIIEPVILDASDDRRDKVLGLRRLCRQRKILFIADEVVSGMRVPDYCFSNMWGLEPDMICLGKALSGHALSVCCGRADVMNTPGTFISTTFGGEIIPIRAALDMLNEITPAKQYKQWELGERLKSEFNRIAPEYIELIGYPSRMTWEASPDMKALFWQEMLHRGHLLGAAFFVSLCVTDGLVTQFLNDSRKVLVDIEEGRVMLHGLPPRPIFKRY